MANQSKEKSIKKPRERAEKQQSTPQQERPLGGFSAWSQNH